MANDGGIITNELYCAHTAQSQTLAWLQVDFGKKYTISSVKIYYRNEGMHFPLFHFLNIHTYWPVRCQNTQLLEDAAIYEMY